MKRLFCKQCSAFTIVEFKLNAVTKYYIWYLDENDDEAFYQVGSEIAVFSSIENISHFLNDNKISYDSIAFDIDEIVASLANDSFDYTAILDFFNIVSDIAKACHIKIPAENGFDFIYDKLFYGQNLSTINKSNKKYHPVFTKTELHILKRHIKTCAQIVENKIIQQPNGMLWDKTKKTKSKEQCK